MKACMVAYTFYENDNRVRRYAETLAKRGDDVSAIVLRRKGQSSCEVIEGVLVHRIQQRTVNEKHPLTYLVKLLAFFFRSAWMLTREHLRAPYDLIHVHSVPDFQVFATLFPKLMGAKIILDIHDIVPELYAEKFRVNQRSLLFRVLLLFERLSVAFSHHVIIANHLWGDRVATRTGFRERCTTILNYPDPAVFYHRERTSRNDGTFVMFYPGTLSWHQGVDLIIQAMGELRTKAPNLRFLVVGDGGEHDRLAALAKEHGIADRVRIVGACSIEEVSQMMANADLGVEPKRKASFANEALSTKILEFMAVGVPVMASDTTVHHMYFNEDTIQFFESENVSDLAAKILVLMNDAAKRRTLCAAGLRFIQENNWGVRKGEYLELVDRLVESPSPRGSRPVHGPADVGF